ncbi:hypothetical protein Q9189_004923 [Teloschistes chrysophthalmus]
MLSHTSLRSSLSFIRPTFPGRSPPVTRIRPQKAALQHSSLSSHLISNRPQKAALPTLTPSLSSHLISTRPQKAALPHSSLSSLTGRSQPITCTRPQKAALPHSSLSSLPGRSQPITRTRPQKAALPPPSLTSTTGRSQPITRIRPQKAALPQSSSSRALSVMKRLAARRQRLGVPTSLPAPPPPAPAPISAPIPGPTLLPLPPTPQAPRATRFRDAMPGSVCRTALVKPSEDLRKGILKRAGGRRSKPRATVRWVAGDITSTKVVTRWIDPHQHIFPSMDRITGTLWGWKKSPLGEASYLTGSSKPANHAGCRRPLCNKRSLHQWETRWDLTGFTGTAQPQLPRGERLCEFNQRHGFTTEESK